MAELDAPLTKVVRTKPVTVNALDDQELVAQKIGKYNLLAVPVLEKDGSVVGVCSPEGVAESRGGRNPFRVAKSFSVGFIPRVAKAQPWAGVSQRFQRN